MYSEIRSVQLLVALLKAYNIKNIVVSPGGSSMAIVHSIEVDEFFTCYSVVDERSAAYVALGISLENNSPCGLVCTSGTAVTNYLSGITEAYYQNIPVLAITADKDIYEHKQFKTQLIKQENIFKNVTKCSVNIPRMINNNDDEWYCKKLIHESLLALEDADKGPVHINIPTLGSMTDYVIESLPKINKIIKINENTNSELWNEKVKSLENFNRILIICGQHPRFTESAYKIMEKFFEKYNCVFSVEHTSNICFKGTLLTYPIIEMTKKYAAKKLSADLIISMGENLVTYQVKGFVEQMSGDNTEHWAINNTKYFKDPFRKLTTIFDCSIHDFFNNALKYSKSNTTNNLQYYNNWRESIEAIELPKDLGFTQFGIIKKFASSIPKNTIVHTSIMNSSRLLQFFNLPKSVTTYSNIGALGIDGSMSSFIGQSIATKKLCFLLIGDLSFFYDMNSLGINQIDSNVRILLINNGGAAEFHYGAGKRNIEVINDNICVSHGLSFKGWIESVGFKYLKANTMSHFDKGMKEFISPELDSPMVLEVFTDMEEDGLLVKEIFDANKDLFSTNKDKAKNKLKKIIGEKNILKGLDIVRKLNE
jgi:2-succinyl-5-enolpyruvyl-6-hydroxy-3-cyclohexene-1-carboxylate synthase